MARLTKNFEGDSQFVPESVHLSDKDLDDLENKLCSRRQHILSLIQKLSMKSGIDADDVHDFNFHATEYVFWSHFIFCDTLDITDSSMKDEIMDQTIAMSYLTSAIQYVPESKDALSHFISLFTDRFDLEDRALKSYH